MNGAIKPACEPSEDCPVRKAVHALEGKWKLYIIFHLMSGTKRFSELRRAIPGVTQQMLTAQLRELENDGIVDRKVYPQVPPKVEYSLTPLGSQLRTITDTLQAWGQQLPMTPRAPTDARSESRSAVAVT